MSGAPGARLPGGRRRAGLLACALVAVAVFAAWSGSLGAPFVFDDGLAITENPTIRKLWPVSSVLSPPRENGLTVNGRPLVNLSLAVNYAFGGTDVRGYHAVNLLVHLFAALTLLGVIRRTLLQTPLRARFGQDALPLALAVALLWAVHPLQTESVTYIVQRAESLMGLFYLLTMYCFIRSTGSPQAGAWRAGCVVACLLGMATKEVMVSAPFVVLLYDRTFVARTFRESWRRHAGFYLALASTWLLLGYLVLSTGSRGGTAGFGVGVAWWNYALTQCDAIVRYLLLALWPRPLVFDYGMDVVQNPAQVALQGMLLVLLVMGTVLALHWRPVLGFAGVWFFAILAPTSSVVPVTTQTIAEHRMYLPLAAVVAGAVLGCYALGGRKSFFIFSGVALGLGFLTARRNEVYRSELILWRDTVAKRPDNARAQNNLGKALIEAGDVPGAMVCFATALRLLPDYPETHNNLGYALAKTGKVAEAIVHYDEALRRRPGYVRAHDNLGNALVQLHRWPEAMAHFEEALRLRPDFADSHWGLGNALAQSNRLDEAIAHYEEALRLDPAYTDAHYSLGAALAQSGRTNAAIVQYRAALRLKPAFPEAENNLGNLLLKSGSAADAIACYRTALHAKPAYHEARVNLGNALLESGHPAEALREYQMVLAAKPDEADAHYGLANACVQLDRLPEAVDAFRETVRLKPGHLAAHVNLGNALLLLGQANAAVVEYEIALRLDPADATARENLAHARQLSSVSDRTRP